MVRKLTSKKAVLFWEAIMIMGSIFVIGAMLFLMKLDSKNTNTVLLEASPQLPSQFPSVVVYSFLESPLSDTLKLPGITTVKDAIWADKCDIVSKAKDEYKAKLLAMATSGGKKTALGLYKEYSKASVLQDELLEIKCGVDSQLPNLESVIAKGNYYYVLTTQSSKLVTVSFLPIPEIILSSSTTASASEKVTPDSSVTSSESTTPVTDSTTTSANPDSASIPSTDATTPVDTSAQSQDTTNGGTGNGQ